MAEIKNFGLVGIGDNVQLGKAGPRLKVNSNVVEARNASDSALAIVRGANAVTSSDLVTLAQLETGLAENAVSDGFQLVLGDVVEYGDGSWTPGAVPLNNNTKVSDAVDSLNEILGKLVPSAPPSFPNGTLSVSNSTGNSPRLASGTPDAANSGLTAGAAVTRITAAGVSSNTFNDVGPGESGTVQLLMNGTVLGSRTLTGTNDGGTYAGLVIADQKDFPVSTPGFWKSVDVSVNGGAAPVGVNKFKVNHTGSGETNEVVFVRDSLTANPALSAGSVAQAAEGTLAYSSGVPHYGDNASLTVGVSISNLAGETYYGGTDPLVISGTNGIISADTHTYAALGIATPIARNTTAATAITPVSVAIDGTNVHHSGTIQGVARNVNGASSAANIASTTILVKRGTTSRIDEMSVPVSGLGTSPNSNNAVRVSLSGGDKPTDAAAAWVQSNALATYEAAVVAGVLGHNVVNYTTGYLPAGPDLSVGRSGAQYVTFRFNRTALSQFKINVTGSYAGCWIKLPGVSDAQPNGGGWWNGFAPYDGAGVPGETGDTVAGCAAGTVMSGNSGTFTMTFGTQSSTNATGNAILVRFRLNAGQSITALSFTN